MQCAFIQIVGIVESSHTFSCSFSVMNFVNYLFCFSILLRGEEKEGEGCTNPEEHRDRHGSGPDQEHEPTAQQRVQ